LINFRKKLSSRTVAAGPHPAAAWVPSPVQSSSPIAATAPRETAPPPAEPNAAEAAPPRYSACREPWRWLNIAANGDVLPCCWAVQPLGNLNEVGSLADIWNGEKMVELRDDIRENRVNKHVCVGASCVYVAR
jgi:MoaA/NifB/PqqE/SkfB family radical SAM enzyme